MLVILGEVYFLNYDMFVKEVIEYVFLVKGIEYEFFDSIEFVFFVFDEWVIKELFEGIVFFVYWQ